MSKKKASRLEVIKMIISSMELSRQEDVLRELQIAGYEATQATLSRDLKELRILKGHNERGVSVYMMPERARYRRVSDTHMTVDKLNKVGVVSIRFSGNIGVIKTPQGHAAHVGVDIDRANIPEVLGTIAGDDTVFVALSEVADKAEVLNLISQLLETTQSPI